MFAFLFVQHFILTRKGLFRGYVEEFLKARAAYTSSRKGSHSIAHAATVKNVSKSSIASDDFSLITEGQSSEVVASLQTSRESDAVLVSKVNQNFSDGAQDHGNAGESEVDHDSGSSDSISSSSSSGDVGSDSSVTSISSDSSRDSASHE